MSLYRTQQELTDGEPGVGARLGVGAKYLHIGPSEPWSLKHSCGDTTVPSLKVTDSPNEQVSRIEAKSVLT